MNMNMRKVGAVVETGEDLPRVAESARLLFLPYRKRIG